MSVNPTSIFSFTEALISLAVTAGVIVPANISIASSGTSLPSSPQSDRVAQIEEIGVNDSDILSFDRFVCERREITLREGETVVSQDEVPATVGYTSDNEVVIFYGWARDYYVESSETALQICARVSAILHTLNQEGVLNLITAATTPDGKAAICAGVTCSRPIFTLLPDEDPQRALADIQTALSLAPIDSTPSIGIVVNVDPDESEEGSRDYVPPLPVDENEASSEDNSSGSTSDRFRRRILRFLSGPSGQPSRVRSGGVR